MTTKAEQLSYAVGDKFKVLDTFTKGEFYFNFSKDDIVVLSKDDSTDFPGFKRESDGEFQYVPLDKVEKLTPAGQAGLVIGTTYRMRDGNEEGYPAGTLVTFTEDDNTARPRFDVPEALDADGWNFLFIEDVEPVPAVAAAPRTAVTFDDTVVTVPVEITVITVKRRLTQEEKDAISAIINKGE